MTLRCTSVSTLKPEAVTFSAVRSADRRSDAQPTPSPSRCLHTPLRPRLASCCSVWPLPAALAAAAQGTGRIVGRVVDAEQGAPDRRRAGRGGRTPRSARVSALDGRYTLSERAGGPGLGPGADDRVRPKTVTGVVVPAGGPCSRTSRWPPRRCSSAEIAVSAEAERGTVNRALEEQRNAANIVNAVTAEQIAQEPRQRRGPGGAAGERRDGAGRQVRLRPRPGRALHHDLAQRRADPEPRAGAQGRARSTSSRPACSRASPPRRPSPPSSRATSAARRSTSRPASSRPAA